MLIRYVKIIVIIICLLLLSTACTKADEEQLAEEISEGEERMILLENDFSRIGFSLEDGSVTLLEDKLRNVSYVNTEGSVPFRIIVGYEEQLKFNKFYYLKSDDSIKLMWKIDEGIELQGKVILEDNGNISFTSNLINNTDQIVLAKEYPIVGHINKIADNDKLAHPFATGMLFDNPFESFATNGGGLRYMPYPESFSGSTMQFFTYYAQGVGGLYCAAYDGDYHQKWLNFYRNDNKLELSLMTGFEDIRAGKEEKTEYPFVISFTNGNDWYEAGDIYKEWAIQQEWCQEGLLYEKSDENKAVWLLENIGLSTFGINAGYDRVQWLKKYSEDVGTPIFHMLGPDWSNTPQTFGSGVPGGYRDWFPTKFNQKNLDFINKNGDYCAPFEFDFLVDTGKADGYNLTKNLSVFPDPTYSFDKYDFRMLCPYTQYTHDFHVNRDVQVIKESGVDSMYYDISANNLIKICLNPDHGHDVGGGAQITKAYREVYEETQKALNDETGKYISLGTEMMCEVFIDSLDYYQARAWARPCSELETWPFTDLIEKGEARLIPMFDYVYHEYAPVRMDGWGKVAEEIGTLYYHNVAKIYLWGAIYELNYEYSPMEVLNEIENKPEEHYFDFKPRGYEYNSDRAGYLEQFANLRVGLGNEYLAYGIMQKPLEIDNKIERYNWFHYNHLKDSKGAIELESMIHSMYKSPKKNSLGLFFANTSDKAFEINTHIVSEDYGLHGDLEIRVYTDFARDGEYKLISSEKYSSSDEIKISINLDPYKVYLVEILEEREEG